MGIEPTDRMFPYGPTVLKTAATTRRASTSVIFAFALAMMRTVKLTFCSNSRIPVRTASTSGEFEPMDEERRSCPATLTQPLACNDATTERKARD